MHSKSVLSCFCSINILNRTAARQIDIIQQYKSKQDCNCTIFYSSYSFKKKKSILEKYKLFADNFCFFDFSITNKFVFKNNYKLFVDNICSCLFLIFDKIAENIEIKKIEKNLNNSINKYQLSILLSIDKISDSNLKSKLKKYLYKKYLKIVQQLS